MTDTAATETAAIEGELLTAGPVMTAREHQQHTALYIAADIAKTVPETGAATLDERVTEVLGAADRVFAWLTAEPVQGASAR